MRFRLKIFIPINTLYMEMEIEAQNFYQAQQVSNEIFKEQFEKSGKNNGNFIIEQI